MCVDCISGLLHYFPVAAINKCHKLDGIKEHKLIVLWFWRLEVQNKGVSKAILPLKSVGEPFFASCYLLVICNL